MNDLNLSLYSPCQKVTPADIMRAAHAFRRDYSLTLADALEWAHQCHAAWKRLSAKALDALLARNFRRARIRRKAKLNVPAVERFDVRPGIERVSLNRREKIADNERRASQGLEPKYTVL